MVDVILYSLAGVGIAGALKELKDGSRVNIQPICSPWAWTKNMLGSTQKVARQPIDVIVLNGGQGQTNT